MTIKTIIFDFGGVVTNSPIEGFKELENTHGYSKGLITSINIDEAKDAPLVQQMFYLPFVKSVVLKKEALEIERFNIYANGK